MSPGQTMSFGAKAKEAADWMNLAKKLEGRRRSEIRSHFQAHIRGQRLGRTGTIFIQ